MMHEREKSDPAIVAAKSANKTVGSKPGVAERMEPRAGAERNASLQSTVRTQGRDAVSLAQARIREAVERNPLERFPSDLDQESALESLFVAFPSANRCPLQPGNALEQELRSGASIHTSMTAMTFDLNRV